MMDPSAIYDLMTAANIFELVMKDDKGSERTFYNKAYTGKLTDEQKSKLSKAENQD